MKLYVPFDEVSDYSCYTIFDDATIRAYKQNPQINSNNDYTDIYIKSHYITKDGIQYISSTEELPLCINSDNITNDYFYRLDFSHIIVIAMFFILLIYFAFKVFSRMFGRWLKV